MANKPVTLVDLNVVLDVLQHRQPHYEHSAQVLNAVSREQVAGLLAAHTVTTLFYLLARLQDHQTATTAIVRLLSSFTVAAVDDQTIRTALAWGWPDFEDAVQMAAAAGAHADYLITRNPKDFKATPVPVLRPEELLAILTKEDNSGRL